MESNAFFSNEGLTATSANFYANKTKEYYEHIESCLNNIDFLNYEYRIIGSSECIKVSDGMTLEELQNLDKNIEHIGKCKALIAWLREAIKEKERMTNEAMSTKLEDYAKMKGITLPNEPKMESAISEEDVIATFDIKTRNLYYELNSKCANIGKLIHPRGPLSVAKRRLHDKISNRTEVSGSGRDTTTRTFIPSVPAEKVDDFFSMLEEKHRSYQASLNSIRSHIEDVINDDKRKKLEIYKVETEKYNQERNRIMTECKQWIQDECERIKKLKIVIPNDLKEIYEIISGLGKKSM